MRRRDFIKGIAGSAAAWPLTARAQQPKKVPVIGVLWPNPPDQFEFIRQGLIDLGYVEGKNVGFEFRWAQGALDRLPELAQELVRLPVDLIITLAPPATLVAKRATQTIPIVFVTMGPVSKWCGREPGAAGGNLTGTTRMISEMSAKHVELLKEIDPALSNLAILWNPNNSSHPPTLKSAETSAQSLSLQIAPPGGTSSHRPRQCLYNGCA